VASSAVVGEGLRSFKEHRVIAIDQQLFDSALDMVLAALLSAAAEKSGRDAPLDKTEVGVWAYAEALPRGILNQDQVGLLMRALSFALGSTAPANLVQTLLDDAVNFVGSLDD